MLKLGRSVALGLVALGLVATGYGYWQAHLRNPTGYARLASLEARVAASSRIRAEEAAKLVLGMERANCLNFRPAKNIMVLQRAQLLQARTRQLIDSLQLLRRQLRAGSNKPELASALASQLFRYQRFSSAAFPHDAALGSLDKSDWLATTNLPLPIVLASLTRLEAQLRSVAAVAIQSQAEKLGSNYDGFDRILPLALPVSETVAPGALYQAQLVLATAGHSSACSTPLSATLSGLQLVKLEAPDLLGQLRVPAAQAKQPDTLRAEWHATIRRRTPWQDTTWQLKVPYYIVRQPRS